MAACSGTRRQAASTSAGCAPASAAAAASPASISAVHGSPCACVITHIALSVSNAQLCNVMSMPCEQVIDVC